jgi:hypothetical protein
MVFMRQIGTQGRDKRLLQWHVPGSISILEFFGYAVVSPMIFREIVGKSEEKRSFRTRDPDEAKHLHS